MSVAVVPCLFVPIVATWRNQFVQYRWQIFFESRLELDGSYGGCTADVEDVNDSRFDLGPSNCSGDVLGQVVHVALTGGGDGELMLKDHTELGYRDVGAGGGYRVWEAAT